MNFHERIPDGSETVHRMCEEMKMKKIRLYFMICLMMTVLTACGNPKGANKLIREAKLAHGSATVVSKTENSDGATVILHDKLQDFDYRVCSYMDAIMIDGSEFGSTPGTGDDFIYALIDKVKADEQIDISNIEQKYNVSFTTDLGPTVYADDPVSAKQAAIEIAAIYQRNNLKHRLDGTTVTAIANSSYYFDRTGKYDKPDEIEGYVTLPKMDWSGRDQQLIEEYTYIAKELDPGAVYVRSETKTFAETGYDLEQVTLTGDCPTSGSSPVTLYYFTASDGREFYVADFCLNNPNRPSEFFEANNY